MLLASPQALEIGAGYLHSRGASWSREDFLSPPLLFQWLGQGSKWLVWTESYWVSLRAYSPDITCGAAIFLLLRKMDQASPRAPVRTGTLPIWFTSKSQVLAQLSGM